MRINTDGKSRITKSKCFLVAVVAVVFVLVSVIVPILILCSGDYFVKQAYATASAGDQTPSIGSFSFFPILGYIGSSALFTSTGTIVSNSGSSNSEEFRSTNAFVEVAENTATTATTATTTATTAADLITYSIGEICGDGVDDNTNGQIDEGCNLSPDCSTAIPSQPVLLSTDHHVEEINIGGAIDPNNDPIVLIITDIIQDEPTNGLGNNDQAPDALLLDGDTVQLRSERAESGDGRVYYISFVANDGKGGQCDGVVAVSVPNNQIGMAIDSGTYFSSLQ